MKNILKTLSVLLILVIGFFSGSYILNLEKQVVQTEEGEDHGEEHTEEIKKGKHRGRLFEKDGFTLELSIYEKDVPPEFRAYAFEKGSEVKPSELSVKVELERFAGKKQVVQFKPKEDYLLGNQEIYEPHSFDAKVFAEYKNKEYVWDFSSYEGRTELKTDEIKRHNIKIEKAQSIDMSINTLVNGEIVLNSDSLSHVVSQLSGIVLSVNKKLGDFVQKGETIAVINSRELADAKRDYIESVHHLELVKDAFTREEKLWKKKISSEEEYFIKKHAHEEGQISNYVAKQNLLTLGLSKKQVESLELNPTQDLATYEIKAPFTGKVIEKHISVGEFIKPESNIFVISDLSTVWASLTINQKDLTSIYTGQTININSEALKKNITGKVIYISPLVSEKNKTVKANVLIDNSSGFWRPGTFITAELKKDSVRIPVAVKKEAIQKFRDWDVVFLNDGNKFEIQPIEIGQESDDWVEIKSGLEANQKYVSENSFVIKADIEKSAASHDH